jgi:tRNA(Leu) C34 or U34 (ribose-2'-O)-methylase TrmL
MTATTTTYGKHAAPVGVTPAIALINPKYGHNVGAAIRAASCYDVKQVFWTGNRVRQDLEAKQRLPREERMKGYGSVEAIELDYFFNAFPQGTVPVAIELTPGAEQLPMFEHPENALYVFGPEDGSIPGKTLQHCHRFVTIPTHHCLNLATAVATVLYDRRCKRQLAGLEKIVPMDEMLHEDRGFIEQVSVFGVES